MFIEITELPSGRFRAEVGCTEVRVKWHDGESRVTQSMGMNFEAPTIEDAINGLVKNYTSYMFTPHLHKIIDNKDTSLPTERQNRSFVSKQVTNNLTISYPIREKSGQ